MMQFKATRLAAAAIALSFVSLGQAEAGHHAARAPATTIVEAAVATKDLSTLVAAVQAAGLVDTLAGPGPFTVFAPTNAAFAELPPATVPTLLRPENKSRLTGILTYHVVPGTYSAARLAALAEKHGGSVVLKTVAGQSLRITPRGQGVVVTDATGKRSRVVAANLRQSNGIVHVIDGVLLPK